MTNNNTNSNVNANQAAAAQAEGFLARIRSAMNTLIHGAPEVVASAADYLNAVSSASDEDVQSAVELTFQEYADTCRNIVGVIRRIPSQADSIEVRNLENAEKVFRAAVDEIKERKGFAAKAKTTLRLIATALYLVAKKCGQFALKAAKAIIVTGIRILAVGGSFIIRIVTAGVKAVRNGFRGLKALAHKRKDNKVRENAPFTVDDMEDDEFFDDEEVVLPEEDEE